MIWKHLFAGILCTCFSLTTRLDARADLLPAYRHLDTIMDQYHGSFDVFTDVAAAGNHFPTRCAIVRNVNNPGDVAGVAFDEAWARGCHSGSTCIRNRFSAVDPTYWGGWYFQNGVLLGSDTQPRCNWGDSPAAGFPLTGATKITFWAKGERGGERLEFFAGGIGRQACGSTPIKPYPDSFPRVPACGHAITLTTAWQQYTIDLRGQDLRYVVGGFGWVTNASQNPIGATFYLDDIRYDKPRFNEMRFPVSYQVLPVAPGNNFDTILRNVGFTYDNVVVLLSYLASGSAEDRRRATLLADAFVYAQNHDRYYSDGRLRNAYQGGDLSLPPGWLPNNRRWTARLPGFWDVVRKKWVEDAAQVGSDTGNMAWVMLGLERAYRILGKPQYLTAARRLGAWAVRNAWDTRGAGGYTGGFEGWEPTPTRRMWKSTEHNIDLYVALMTLSDLTPEPEKSVWRVRALHAKRFVRAMWGKCGAGHFATGTTTDGATPNCDFAPTDVNTWGLMALGEAATYGVGVDWVQQNAKVTEPCFQGALATGSDFNHDRDGIWWEGTAHTVLAQRIRGRHTDANLFLRNLRLAQLYAPRTNRMGVVATCRDQVTTGISGFLLFNRLHIAATAWYTLAEQNHNPYWGIKTSEPIPHEREWTMSDGREE